MVESRILAVLHEEEWGPGWRLPSPTFLLVAFYTGSWAEARSPGLGGRAWGSIGQREGESEKPVCWLLCSCGQWLQLWKPLWVVTAAMKLNDACSLEGKLDNVWKSQDISLLRKVNIVSSVQSLNSVQLFVTHRQQNGRLPCPSQTPRACSNLCTSSWWCHPTNLSSIVRFSSCLQSFPASGSFPVSWLHQVANVLELQLQHQSFQWIFRTDFL